MSNILIFAADYLPRVGGAEVAMKELTDRLVDHEFLLVCPRYERPLPKQERLGRVSVYRVGFGWSGDRYLMPVLGALKGYWLTRNEKKPVIWSLMASYGGFAALFFTWLRPSARMLLTLQEGDPLEYYEARLGLLNHLHRRIFRRANAVQAISAFLAQWAKHQGALVVPHVIPNGVHLDRFKRRMTPVARQEFRKTLGFKEADRVIVTVSRLVKKNGTRDLIEALSLLSPEYKLLIAGVGEEREMLEALAQSRNVSERVIFYGHCSQEMVPELLQSCDVFCRPSLSEGQGISFIEAMASGLPTIGTKVGGIPDFLREGETGFLCEPAQPASIARAIERVFQLSEDERRQVVKRAERLVDQEYRWEEIAPRIDALLGDLAL